MNKHQSRDIVFIDIETTDVNESTASVLELGAARYTSKGELLATFQRKIIPKSIVTPQAARVNGYSELSWKSAHHFSVALDILCEKGFVDFPAKATIASYFMFDRNIIVNQCKREGIVFPLEEIPWLDVAAMTYPLVVTGRVDTRRLKDLAEYLEIPPWQEHRALEDAKGLAACYFAFLKKFNRAILAGDIAKHTIDKVGTFLSKHLSIDTSQ
jgi:DNA polymerase III subunit alpha, Gram-positive type